MALAIIASEFFKGYCTIPESRFNLKRIEKPVPVYTCFVLFVDPLPVLKLFHTPRMYDEV